MLEQFIGICLLVIGIKSFVDAFHKAKPIDLDNVELFRIYDIQERPAVAVKQKQQTQTIKKSKSSKPKEQRNSNGYTQLQQDCFDTLKAIGFKSVKERRFMVSNTFNNHNIKSVEDFLKIAVIKPS